MSEQSTDQPPAGWYNDPSGRPLSRWWNGREWTEHSNAAPQVVATPSTNGLATASLVLGLVTAPLALSVALLPLAILPGLIAVIFGFIGDAKAKRLNGLGHSRALWGGFLGLMPAFVFFFMIAARTITEYS
ncbi:DUF2510 domain-containing protein [Cryobacterium sp. Sr8]|uniref:DUF2510 domain-containing protein n=1 Tax=Cryobacterium sp. Sr8 TaxID=1259203 RepID=UPI00106BC209|nr:DUF2510 domain-containing protein [Cryobacterium sp. Sr8]TFD80312.1 DUF2510 domain-containing protein [Cryobacterium sp. Sr8]